MKSMWRKLNQRLDIRMGRVKRSRVFNLFASSDPTVTDARDYYTTTGMVAV
tara:strand:- start:1134 stop:1286 length:153 start_codon:yes stop_codon:yes gene_type:complete